MNITISLSDITAWLGTLTRPAPGRDWLIAVLLGLLVFVATLAIAGYLFFGVKSGLLVEGGNGPTVSTTAIPREKMQKVLERYGERLANFESKNFGTFILKDPHLTLTPKK